jgi:tetratricopeptide (TPR) repeat protein
MLVRVGCVRSTLDRPRMLEHATRAIALARAARLGWLAANCEQNVGIHYFNTGEMGSAIAWFLTAEETARAAHSDPTLAASLQYHGAALRTLGYVFFARKQLTAAIRVAQRIDDRNVEAWSLLNVAGTARLIGDASTTASALRRAEVLFQLTGDVSGYENSMLEKSLVQLMLGDYQGAMRIAVRGRAYADSLNDVRMAIRSLYVQSDVHMRMNQLDDAAKQLDEAEAMIRKQLGPAWLTQLQEYRGLLSLRRGENAAAIRTLVEVRDAYSNRQELSRYSVNGALSLARLRTGDSVAAARTLIEANHDLDAVRDTMAEGGLRRLVMPPSIWGGTNGNIDEVLAAFVSSPRWLPTVFAVTERSRSRALLNGMIGSESTTDSVAASEARQRVRASAAVLSEVQRALKPTTALLVYAGGAAKARTALMVITKTTARGITLAPLDSLDRDIVRWLALMESGESGLGAGRQVAAAVLGSAVRGLPATIKRLVIVPQGALYRVPFQALPIGAGVLGDRAVVTISPSVSLALAYAAEPRSVPARVLALGAGDTEIASELPQSMDLNIERSDRGNPLAPLRAAADEARAAANWGRGSLALTGLDASEAALKREARGPFTVLHAAAHALTSDQTLGANYLILRPDANDDGYVSGGELADLTSHLAMVVLSGCRTTGDFGSRGDAIDGLVAPLLARGVRTVVASHWAVSDQWTKVLMERFYQNLARGQTTAEAMNEAQMSLRRQGVPSRFWAAFSVIGDGALTFGSAAATGGGH